MPCSYFFVIGIRGDTVVIHQINIFPYKNKEVYLHAARWIIFIIYTNMWLQIYFNQPNEIFTKSSIKFWANWMRYVTQIPCRPLFHYLCATISDGIIVLNLLYYIIDLFH